jgi:hypothetical protein
MTRPRATRPRAWNCRLCPASGYDLDPRTAWETHYFDFHHTPAPF